MVLFALGSFLMVALGKSVALAIIGKVLLIVVRLSVCLLSIVVQIIFVTQSVNTFRYTGHWS